MLHIHDILKEEQFNNTPNAKILWLWEKQTNMQPFNALT